MCLQYELILEILQKAVKILRATVTIFSDWSIRSNNSLLVKVLSVLSSHPLKNWDAMVYSEPSFQIFACHWFNTLSCLLHL